MTAMEDIVNLAYVLWSEQWDGPISTAEAMEQAWTKLGQPDFTDAEWESVEGDWFDL